MYSYLIFGITYAFAAAVQPGPFQSFLITRTLSQGWKNTLPAAFAPLLSDGPIIFLVLVLLSGLSSDVIHVLQIGGGIFLLYLARGAYGNWRQAKSTAELASQSTNQTIWKATVVNLFNPAPYLGWSLIMGPLFLQGWRETPIHGVALLVGFYLTLILITMGIILLFGAARQIGPKVQHIMLGFSVVALALFGLYELWQGMSAFSRLLS